MYLFILALYSIYEHLTTTNNNIFMSMSRDHSVYITSLSEYVTWPFCVHYKFVLSMSRDPTVCPFHKTLKFDLSQLSENGKENVCSYIPVASHYGVHLTMEYTSLWSTSQLIRYSTVFWFISGFPWYTVVAHKEVTEPRVSIG